jgi:hypothetical protein
LAKNIYGRPLAGYSAAAGVTAVELAETKAADMAEGMADAVVINHSEI